MPKLYLNENWKRMSSPVAAVVVVALAPHELAADHQFSPACAAGWRSVLALLERVGRLEVGVVDLVWL